MLRNLLPDTPKTTQCEARDVTRRFPHDAANFVLLCGTEARARRVANVIPRLSQRPIPRLRRTVSPQPTPWVRRPRRTVRFCAHERCGTCSC